MSLVDGSVPHYVNDNALLGLENCRVLAILTSSGYSSICSSFIVIHINLSYVTKYLIYIYDRNTFSLYVRLFEPW